MHNYSLTTELLETTTRRIASLGVDALSDQQLIGLVTGITDEPLLAKLAANGLFALAQEPAEVLSYYYRLHPQASMRLTAAVELGRRLHRAKAPQTPLLTTPEAIEAWIRPYITAARREEFHVLCFNARQRLILHARTAIGSSDQCHVDPRELLAPPIMCRASGVALVHNHPSGECKPSFHDIEFTGQVQQICAMLQVCFLDHIIIAGENYTSLRARGFIKQ